MDELSSIVCRYDDISVPLTSSSSMYIFVEAFCVPLLSLNFPVPGSALTVLVSKSYSKDAPPKFPSCPVCPVPPV